MSCLSERSSRELKLNYFYCSTHLCKNKQTEKEGIEKYKQMDIFSGDPALIFQYHHNTTLLVHHFRVYKALSFKLQCHKASKEKLLFPFCRWENSAHSLINESRGSEQKPGSYRKCSVCVSRSVVSDSLGSLMQPTRLLCPWDFPVKSTGVGCHFLLERIFLTQGLNLGLPH